MTGADITFKCGDPVTVYNRHTIARGQFNGTVTEVTDYGVTVMPCATALRLWYPNGIEIGKAHFGDAIVHDTLLRG